MDQGLPCPAKPHHCGARGLATNCLSRRPGRPRREVRTWRERGGGGWRGTPSVTSTVWNLVPGGCAASPKKRASAWRNSSGWSARRGATWSMSPTTAPGSTPVFPILVVFAALAGTRLNSRLAGKVVIGVVALAASLAMTASYLSGYRDFRSDKMTKPLSGDVIRSAPTLLTLNPIESADRTRGSAHVGCAAQLRDGHVPSTAQLGSAQLSARLRAGRTAGHWDLAATDAPVPASCDLDSTEHRGRSRLHSSSARTPPAQPLLLQDAPSSSGSAAVRRDPFRQRAGVPARSCPRQAHA